MNKIGLDNLDNLRIAMEDHTLTADAQADARRAFYNELWANWSAISKLAHAGLNATKVL